MKNIKKITFSNMVEFTKAFPDEKACRNHLAKIRWGKQPVCYHCGSIRKIYSINDGKVLTCADCRKQFTVRVGTIFEDSALPLQKWFFAIYIFTAHKKGISSVQLAKDIGVTQKTAWFMLHRIRHAVRTRTFNKPLDGIIEVDETYVGGRYTRNHEPNENQSAVFGMKQRGGKIVAQTVKNRSKETLQKIMRKTISQEAVIFTDEAHVYNDLEESFDSHETVKHSAKEYVRGEIHTNSIESFWALFKRGYVGTYHWMSKKHLDKYIDEFEFRLNHKDISDPARLNEALDLTEGKLTYKRLIS